MVNPLSSNPLGVLTDFPGLTAHESVVFWAEAVCDQSLYQGEFDIKEIQLYKPPPPVLKKAARPFLGIQDRGVAMVEPMVDDFFAEYKRPDQRTNLYTPKEPIMPARQSNAALFPKLSEVF